MSTDNNIWYLSIFIILTVVIVLILLRSNGIIIEPEYKYLASAIGLSGFIIAVMGDGLFIIDN